MPEFLFGVCEHGSNLIECNKCLNQYVDDEGEDLGPPIPRPDPDPWARTRKAQHDAATGD